MNQYNGQYEAKEAIMQVYLEKLKEQSAQFESCELTSVLINENAQADALSKLASSSMQDFVRTVLVEVQHQKSSDKIVAVQYLQPMPVDERKAVEWYDDIVAFKTDGNLPADDKATKKIHRDSPWYLLHQGVLYKKSFSLHLLRCLSASKSVKLLEEIHEGCCGNHLGGRTMDHKALRAGYYWPTMVVNAQKHVKMCDKCESMLPLKGGPEPLLFINQQTTYSQF